jgi:hypothetical protein
MTRRRSRRFFFPLKEYTHRIKAQFQAGSGDGQRLTGRACEFKFTR